MEYIIICIVALAISGLTLISGFGLGTILMPVFAIYFPLQVAIAATAIVHMLTNVFSLILVGKNANWSVVLRFTLIAAIAAIIGAMLLGVFSSLEPVAHYQIGSQIHNVTVIKIIIAILILGFAMFDLIPRLEKLTFDRKYLPLGGLLSGFFGGLSGFQGALRSAFLIKSGLSKEQFIGTGVVSAVIIDLSRLIVYGITFYKSNFDMLGQRIWGLVLAATISAFLGAFIGSRLIKKVTLKAVQITVGILLIFIGIGLGIGLI
jgi:uncharacterized protein